MSLFLLSGRFLYNESFGEIKIFTKFVCILLFPVTKVWFTQLKSLFDHSKSAANSEQGHMQNMSLLELPKWASVC